MTYHKRLNLRHETFSPGEKGIAEIRAKLEDERRLYRESPRDSHNERIAAANVEDLEQRLERVEKNEEIRTQRLKREADEKTTAAKARQQGEAEAIRADQRRRYPNANSDATDAEFAAAYPDLLAGHRRHRMNQVEDAQRVAAERIRSMFQP